MSNEATGAATYLPLALLQGAVQLPEVGAQSHRHEDNEEVAKVPNERRGDLQREQNQSARKRVLHSGERLGENRNKLWYEKKDKMTHGWSKYLPVLGKKVRLQ